jgi:hypothetical protein
VGVGAIAVVYALTQSHFGIALLMRIALYVGIIVVFVLIAAMTNHFGVLTASDTSFSKKDIDARIRRLIQTFADRKMEIPDLLIPTGVEGDPLEWITQQYGLSFLAKAEMRYTTTDGVPARIRTQSFRNYAVEVDPKLRLNKTVLLAALAHECAHMWVDVFVDSPNAPRSEERTVDVAAILLGGGQLILRAMRQDATLVLDGTTVGTKTTNYRIGYLSLLEFAYVMAVYQQITGCNEGFLLSFSPVAKKAYCRAKKMIRTEDFACSSNISDNANVKSVGRK